MKRIVLIVLAIVAAGLLTAWGVKALIHHNAMVKSVREWRFAGNFSQPGYYTTCYNHIYFGDGHSISIPYQVWNPPVYWSEWKGLDAEDYEQTQRRAWCEECK